MPDRAPPRELVVAALQRLVDRLGVDAVVDGGVRGLVADELGADSTTCRAELDAIARAADARVPMKLREGATTEVVERDVGRGTADEDETRWSVAAWSAVVPPPAPPDRQMLVTSAPVADDDSHAKESDPDGPGTSKQRKRWAIVIGSLVLLGAIVGSTVYLAMQDDTQARLELGVGQCFNDSLDGSTYDVVVVGCDEFHDGLVVAEVHLGVLDESYPGATSLASRAGLACQPLDNAADAGHKVDWFFPDRASWESGRRTAVCIEGTTNGARLSPE